VALLVPVHAGLALWRLGPDLALSLSVDAYGRFLWAGRIALFLFTAGAAAGIVRAVLGKRWRIIHMLNWAAFIVASTHSQMGGPSFRAWPLRVLGILLALGVAAAFVVKRVKMAKKPAR
jgi:DMSO/TMAO reductase YedYZ heme-binding membrane subunit